jgi:hypothetical protein
MTDSDLDFTADRAFPRVLVSSTALAILRLGAVYLEFSFILT